ncbi:MAG: bifunctional tetrahydrofolate synthase/dihydrofolate synthase, partial [Steroidobacteraceae bacterium]
MSRRTLAQWLERQESVHARSIDLGLERVSTVARTLDLLRPPYRVVTVAGTNGKGSTVAYLEALLLAHGFRTGSLTSPHLRRYNERVRVQGEEAGDEELIRAFERIDAARGATTLTFFEYNALAALLVFAERRIEVAVLEVGLGGRLDATNIVDADVAVLCSVGFDHRDWLGDTLEAIGAEKAGIFRAGRPAVLGTPRMPASVQAAAERLRAQLSVAERDFSWSVRERAAPAAAAVDWTYRGLRTTLEGLPPPALAGAVQFRNAATALAACECLPGMPALEARRVAEALQAVQLAGRFQSVWLTDEWRTGDVQWILDVAHNEPAAQILAENLLAGRRTGRTYAVCSILRDKDVEAIGRVVAPLIQEWILCGVEGPRGSTAGELAARLAASVSGPRLADSVAAGCARARSLARAGDRVVVFGSFATVTAALEWLQSLGA